MSTIKDKSTGTIGDIELLKGIAGRDNKVIQHLYKLHFPTIERMILNNSGSKEQAQDVFQESVLVLYDKVTQQGFVLECKLKTFLYAVSKRLWLKQLNKKDVNSSTLDSDMLENIPDIDDDVQLHEQKEVLFDRMEDALKLLGEPCQGIIKDFYLHNKSMQEICDKLGYTNTDNAKTQKYKCLQRLKKLFFSR